MKICTCVKREGKNYADYDGTTVKNKSVAAIKPVFMRVLWIVTTLLR